MVTHTLVQSTNTTVAPTNVTKAQFVKAYRTAEKRAIVSAGGLAFSAEDRLLLNSMRVTLGYDFTQAASAVSLNAEDYARHWQRFQHWANQIKKGLVRVAPPADEIADRTHKSTRAVKNPKKPRQAARTQPQGLNKEQVKVLGTIAVETADNKAQALHQLGMIFATREEAEAHLQEVMYGLVRLGMSDMDALVPSVQAKLIKAKEEIELEAKAQAIVTVLERSGAAAGEASKILELARQLMPA